MSNTTLLPITKVSDGSIVSVVTSTVTAATIGAYGIRIQYSAEDKFEQPPDPERFNKVRLAYATQKPVQGHGLGAEAKVGLGIGICFAAGLTVLGILIFLKRKRASHQTEVAKDHTTLSTSSQPGSTPQIRRKPVPSTHSSASSLGSPGTNEGYSAVSTSEVQNNAPRDATHGQGRRQKLFEGISLWSWEILSLFTSVLSLAAIIIVLDVYENRRLDEWTPRVPINAVISILSVLFKGSLALPVTEGISQLKWLMFAEQPRALSQLDVYDKASRGAWGSTMMIFGQFKSEQRAYLASFGAALALIALATDPFAQATISLYGCAKNGTEIASIPRANNYSTNLKSNALMNGRISIPMQLATYRGILEPPANSSASVSVSCATGNCTFPEASGATFMSLTMCSKARDMTDRVRAFKNGWLYTLDSQMSLSGGALFNMTFVTAPDASFQKSKGNIWNRTSVLDVYVMSMIKNYTTDCELPFCQQTGISNANFTPSAFLFSLFPCVQTFSANLSRGQYSEEATSEEYLHFVGPEQGAHFQLAKNQTMINGTWMQCASTDELNDTNTIPVLSRVDDGSPPSSRRAWYSPECVFEFYGGRFLGEFLGKAFFTTSGVADDASEDPSIWQTQLWRNGTTDVDLVANFAKGLATSIGAQMREGAIGPSMLREARGTTLVEKTCIRIHWGYISFFGAVLVLEVLFLGAVMVMSYRSKLKADWKSSILAVAFLSAGTSKRGRWHADNPESEESLRDAARSVKASLTDDSGHWQLRTGGQRL